MPGALPASDGLAPFAAAVVAHVGSRASTGSDAGGNGHAHPHAPPADAAAAAPAAASPVLLSPSVAGGGGSGNGGITTDSVVRFFVRSESFRDKVEHSGAGAGSSVVVTGAGGDGSELSAALSAALMAQAGVSATGSPSVSPAGRRPRPSGVAETFAPGMVRAAAAAAAAALAAPHSKSPHMTGMTPRPVSARHKAAPSVGAGGANDRLGGIEEVGTPLPPPATAAATAAATATATATAGSPSHRGSSAAFPITAGDGASAGVRASISRRATSPVRAEAAMAPAASPVVPPTWSVHQSSSTGLLYYHNRVTGASAWEEPADFDGVYEPWQAELLLRVAAARSGATPGSPGAPQAAATPVAVGTPVAGPAGLRNGGSAEDAAQWSLHRTPDGRRYYYNAATKDTTWETPACLLPPSGGGTPGGKFAATPGAASPTLSGMGTPRSVSMKGGIAGAAGPGAGAFPVTNSGGPAATPAAAPVRRTVGLGRGGWAAAVDAEGYVYYFNTARGITQWERPTDF